MAAVAYFQRETRGKENRGRGGMLRDHGVSCRSDLEDLGRVPRRCELPVDREAPYTNVIFTEPFTA